MMRGEVVVVALSGDLGKPRPAVVVQSDLLSGTTTVVVLPITSTLVDAPLIRHPVAPEPRNGLRVASQIMVDKPSAVRRERIGQTIGRLDEADMTVINRLMALVLGIA